VLLLRYLYDADLPRTIIARKLLVLNNIQVNG
jgi:hypothetical protein